MAYAIPNGSHLFIATGYDADKTITATSNANPAVVTSASHGYTLDDIVEVTLGWSELQGRMAKVANPLSGSWEAKGIDTTDSDRFPPSGGAGTSRKVSGWTEITQILGSSSEGGEPTYATGKPLDTGKEFRIPTGNSAEGLNLDLGDDDSLPWFGVLATASRQRTPRALRLLLPSGSEILYNVIVHFNQTPTLNVDNVMMVRASLSFQAELTRYSA